MLRSKLFLLILVIAAVIVGDILIVLYRQHQEGEIVTVSSESGEASTSVKTSTADLNAYGKRIASSDIAPCAPLTDTATRAMLPPGKTKVFVFPEQPGYMSLSAEIIAASGAVTYASVTVSELSGGSCLVSTELTTHWVDGCDAVADAIFPAFQPLRYLNKRILVLKNKEEERAFLLPVAQGCLSWQKRLFSAQQ